jgi:hypothetical protein
MKHIVKSRRPQAAQRRQELPRPRLEVLEDRIYPGTLLDWALGWSLGRGGLPFLDTDAGACGDPAVAPPPAGRSPAAVSLVPAESPPGPAAGVAVQAGASPSPVAGAGAVSGPEGGPSGTRPLSEVNPFEAAQAAAAGTNSGQATPGQASAEPAPAAAAAAAPLAAAPANVTPTAQPTAAAAAGAAQLALSPAVAALAAQGNHQTPASQAGLPPVTSGTSPVKGAVSTAAPVGPPAQPARLSTAGQGNAGAPPGPDPNPVAFSTFYSYGYGNPAIPTPYPYTEGAGLDVYRQTGQPDKVVFGGLTRATATSDESGFSETVTPDGQITDDSLGGSGRMVVHQTLVNGNGTYSVGEMGPVGQTHGFIDWNDGTMHHLLDVDQPGGAPDTNINTVVYTVGADNAGNLLVGGSTLAPGDDGVLRPTAFLRGFRADLSGPLVLGGHAVDCIFVGLHVTGYTTVTISAVTNFHIDGTFSSDPNSVHVDISGNITTQVTITEGFVFCVDIVHCAIVAQRRIPGGVAGGLRVVNEPNGQGGMERHIYTATTIPDPDHPGHTALLLEKARIDPTTHLFNILGTARFPALALGGATDVRGSSMVRGANGSYYVTGSISVPIQGSSGSGFAPTPSMTPSSGPRQFTSPPIPTHLGAYVAKFSSDLQTLQGFYYLGSSGSDTANSAGQAIAVLGGTNPNDPVQIYVTGWTESPAFDPIEYSFQGTFDPAPNVHATRDAFITHLQEPLPLFATNTVLTSSLNPSHVGQSVTFTATVSPYPAGFTPTGNVSFYVDDSLQQITSLDNNGSATYTTASLSAGVHTVRAVYGGSVAYSGSEDSLFQTVIGSSSSGSGPGSTPSPTPSSSGSRQVTTPERMEMASFAQQLGSEGRGRGDGERGTNTSFPAPSPLGARPPTLDLGDAPATDAAHRHDRVAATDAYFTRLSRRVDPDAFTFSPLGT